MLNKFISVSGAILLVLFLFGCQEQSVTDPVSENSNELNLNKGVLESATGSGHIVVGDNELRVFTHNAKNKANGTSGRFNLNRHDTGIHFGGSVICLNVDGNKAYFAGVIETSNSEGPNWLSGAFVIWSTIDNGEGNNSPADQITFVQTSLGWTEEDVRFLCESGFDHLDYYDIDHGNIQIR